MPGAAAEPQGTLATALSHAARLLTQSPALAEAQSREILKAAPGHPQALLLLAAALRRQGAPAAARDVAQPLAARHPQWAEAHAELGLALAALGDTRAAVTALERAIDIEPRHGQAWRALGDAWTLLGDTAQADAAYANHIRAGVREPALMEAANALCENRLPEAEHLLRGFLKRQPTEVAAIRMLAETGARLGRLADAEALLARCLELAPGFTAARHNYAAILYRQSKPLEALAQVERLLAAEPGNPGYRNLKAAALSRIGEYDQAIAIYEAVLAEFPRQPKGWMSLGHALKTVGRQADAVAAYRRGVELQPSLGEAWWSLANLKTFRFSQEDLAAMEGALAGAGLSDDDRLHLHFALGKAREDAREWEAAFGHYTAGNALRRRTLGYRAQDTTDQVDRAVALFTPRFLAARAGQGCPAPDPIFVVGLPRAGSTLVEQILASHSQVEGTQELPDIITLARRLGGKPAAERDTAYPEALAELSPGELKALGEEYLERARVHRKLGRPFFIDKMPNNWAHVGLIHLILPNARIIDARRHPLGCCFSGFKQHFARGQGFTYSLDDVGRYYADYVRLMAHVDAVLPGRVHRVIYEQMVADPEAEVRRLLDYCRLPFEAGCLRFYENDRAVRTASSEQVRRPIYADATEHWRNFEPWLEPLKAALGPVLETYPKAPG
ncbi:sulfotransferase [Phenylobacterium sp.]|uniref:tetratricopeptide repeat-containing sulfotransferase family protein n=1 Tax=Phenylobacterium sp. TaxID=1871053 RepID=UPI0035AF9391